MELILTKTKVSGMNDDKNLRGGQKHTKYSYINPVIY
jgi:hypothetical protein